MYFVQRVAFNNADDYINSIIKEESLLFAYKGSAFGMVNTIKIKVQYFGINITYMYITH